MTPDLSRRRFLASSGSVGGIAWLKLSGPALAAVTASACSDREAGANLRSLSAAQAREISAIAARLIPTTETPGAEEAGVIHFIDRAFAEELQDDLADFLGGLSDFLEEAAAANSGDVFSSLPAHSQDEFLATQEGNAFFERVLWLTIVGFFAMSSYGGNRNQVGWDLIGFEGHGAWTAPFGYYDAEAARNGN